MVDQVAAPPPVVPNRNPYIAGFDQGVANAAAANELLRGLILQIDGNTKDLQKLIDIASIGTSPTAPTWPTTSADRAAQYQFLVTNGVDVPPAERAYINTASPSGLPAGVTVSYPPLDGVANPALLFNPPQDVSIAVRGGIIFKHGGVIYAVTDLTKDWTPFIDRAPTADELAAMKPGIEQAAQTKTQLGQSQQAYMQKLLVDKSTDELFATGVMQRFGSMMDDITRRIG